MAIKTNFFDNGGSYSAQDFVRPFASLLTDGVYGSTALQVNAHSPANLSADIAIGAATKNGYYINSDSLVNVPIIANTSGYNRIDAIVLDIDTTNKVTTCKAVQGIPSSSPVTPTLGSNQLLLATVLVGNNVSVINQNVVTDSRQNVDLFGSQLAAKLNKTMNDITLYVNSGTGSDTNDGLSSGTSLKTIQAAINKIPYFGIHTATINVVAGTYNEDIQVVNINLKTLNITGNTDGTITTSGNYKINSILVESSKNVNITGFKPISTTNIPVKVMRSQNIGVLNTDISTAAAKEGVYVYASSVIVQRCQISNRYEGIYADGLSTIMSDTNSGAGNTTALHAIYGTTIIKNSTQPSGTTNERTETGGVIR